MTTMREWRHRRIEAMGITLVNYRDPVDGSEVPVIDEAQFGKLIAYIDAQLTQAVQSREIVIRYETLSGEDAEKLVRDAHQKGRVAEREAIRNEQWAKLQALADELRRKP